MTNAGTLDNWLRVHAINHAVGPALHFEGRTFSYAQLVEDVDATANILSSVLQLQHGDCIAYYGKNNAYQVFLLFAAAKLGLIFTPLNWRLAPAELNYIVGNARAKIVFTDINFFDQADTVLAGLPDVRNIAAFSSSQHENLPEMLARTTETTNHHTSATLQDPLLIVYTSGTTGRPKGAVLTQEAVQWNAIISQDAHDLGPTDHILNFLPMFHVGGINIQMLPTFFVGGQVTLLAQFSLEETFEILGTAKITLLTLVPTILQALLSAPQWQALDVSSLKCITIGSTDVPTHLIEAAHERGVPVIQVYGATETGPVTIYQKISDAFSTVGSIGKCGRHVEVKLTGLQGENVPDGTPGEIWVKAPNILSHYWRDPDATAASLSQGWFRTGDIASRDEAGNFWFTDRTNHVIISGGENIYPAELERILLRVPGVSEAVVVGKSDAKWGEVPVAVLVAREGTLPTADIVDAFVGKIAKFKHPKEVHWVSELPRNALGKIIAAEVKHLLKSVS